MCQRYMYVGPVIYPTECVLTDGNENNALPIFDFYIIPVPWIFNTILIMHFEDDDVIYPIAEEYTSLLTAVVFSWSFLGLT